MRELKFVLQGIYSSFLKLTNAYIWGYFWRYGGKHTLEKYNNYK